MIELVADAVKAQASIAAEEAYIKPKSIKESSMVLHKGQPYSLMELKKDTYLVDDIIIHMWEVLKRMDKADDMNLLDPFKLPFFDYEKFPFLMVRDTYSNFYLANVKEFTTQVLVRTN